MPTVSPGTVHSGRTAAVYYIDTTTSVEVAGPLTMTAVVTGYVYRIATAEGDTRFIDPSKAMTVSVGGVAKVKGVDYIVSGPCINFRTEQTGTVTIEDFFHFDVVACLEAKEWNISVDFDTEVLTPFGSGGWKQRVAMMSGAQISIGKWWADSDILSGHTANGLFVVVLFTKLTNASTLAGLRYECYGRMNKDTIKTAANGVISEDLTVDVEGRIYYFGS